MRKEGTNRGAGTAAMLRLALLTGLLGAIAVSTGCVYRINIQQGNLLKKEQIEQLEVGMTRKQVRFLLGTPMVDDPFHQERWDYIYYIRIGRRDPYQSHMLTVYFDGDTVARIERRAVAEDTTPEPQGLPDAESAG